jgi:ribosome-binding protein aMBF1 (putative translation factor)
MSETLFPERLRCKTCRKKLEDTVLNGMFCSYRCVPAPAPSPSVSVAPRHCKREVNSVWSFKTKYRYEKEVPEKLRNDPATNIYRCDYCLFLHVGHSRVKPEDATKLRRVVHDETILGSVIQRRREQLNWDKKRLAHDLNVPMIRITEIENNSPKMSVHVLFKVMNRLKLTVEIIER